MRSSCEAMVAMLLGLLALVALLTACGHPSVMESDATVQIAEVPRSETATSTVVVGEDEATADLREPADTEPDATPAPTTTPKPDSTATPKVDPTATPSDVPDEATATPAGAAGQIGDDAVTILVADGGEIVLEPTSAAAVVTPSRPPSAPALTQVLDENPGPPFSVEVSLNLAAPSPLLDGLTVYTVSGLLRNDGDQVYAVNTVNFTFYDADGFRGGFYRFPGRRYGEWIEHGAMEATFDCMLLAPDEACPFIAEIAAYSMGSFYVHADAVVAEWRKPAPVEIWDTSLVDQGSNVRISGTVHNPNDYAIKNVVVDSVLLDGNDQITSMGAAYYVLSIAPGASVPFTAMVPAEAYVTHGIYAQAEGDFR